MTLKTILVDPENNYEIVEDSAALAVEFNSNNPDHVPMSEQDMDDLNKMFLNKNLLEEVYIH